jgi:hypothetical protein
MAEVNIRVSVRSDVYSALLRAANEVGVPVSEFAGALIANYLEENYGEV